MLLVDLNCKFECDWFVELSDNNLASELVGVFKPITIEEIVIFMINSLNSLLKLLFNCIWVWVFFPCVMSSTDCNRHIIILSNYFSGQYQNVNET